MSKVRVREKIGLFEYWMISKTFEGKAIELVESWFSNCGVILRMGFSGHVIMCLGSKGV